MCDTCTYHKGVNRVKARMAANKLQKHPGHEDQSVHDPTGGGGGGDSDRAKAIRTKTIASNNRDRYETQEADARRARIRASNRARREASDSSSSPRVPKAKTGDKVYVQSAGMRRRGQQPVGGHMDSDPDPEGNISVAGHKFHVSDIREVHPKK